jgi:hypothetical protein
MIHVHVNQVVEYDSKRDGKTYKGVVVRLPKTSGARIEIRTLCGQEKLVPPSWLRPSSIDDTAKSRIIREGEQFSATRAKHQNAHEKARIRRGQEHIDLHCLKRGQTVRYFATESVFNGTQVEVVSVDHARGKVTVTNPKADLRDRAAAFGGLSTNHLDNAVSTVTVWADHVRP